MSRATWLEETKQMRFEEAYDSWQSKRLSQRLKRVFNIDIETCEQCGGQVKVIASIEDPAVIGQILKHLKQKAVNSDTTHHHMLPSERAPPQSGLLFDPLQNRLFD